MTETTAGRPGLMASYWHEAAEALVVVDWNCRLDGHDPVSCPVRAVLARGLELESSWLASPGFTS
jgi:hypothetical protein